MVIAGEKSCGIQGEPVQHGKPVRGYGAYNQNAGTSFAVSRSSDDRERLERPRTRDEPGANS